MRHTLWLLLLSVSLSGCLELSFDDKVFSCESDADCETGEVCRRVSSDLSVCVDPNNVGDVQLGDTNPPDTTDTNDPDTNDPDTNDPDTSDVFDCTQCESLDNVNAFTCTGETCLIDDCDEDEDGPHFDCDGDPFNGCEVDPFDDNNCGECGFVCGTDLSCEAGECVPSCPQGKDDCDADGICETTIIDNPLHCGGCGIACDTDKYCDDDTCEPFRVSCLDIQSNTSNTTDGIYRIDPDLSGPSNPTDVYCEMENLSGGWTRLFGMDVVGSANPPEMENLESGLAAASLGRGGVPAGPELVRFRDAAGLTLIRFECKKPSAPKVHIQVENNEAIDYLIGQVDSPFPATGSFIELFDDASPLTEDPSMWGFSGGMPGLGDWGDDRVSLNERLIHNTFFIEGGASWSADGNEMRCGDVGSSVDGEWSIWVR